MILFTDQELASVEEQADAMTEGAELSTPCSLPDVSTGKVVSIVQENSNSTPVRVFWPE